MSKSLSHLLIAGLSLLLLPALVQAQAMSIIGGSNDARHCAFEARLTGQSQLAGRQGLESCDRALEYGQLSLKDRAATHVNRGILLTAVGRFSAALDDFDTALEINPQLAEPYVGRGNLVFLAGRYALAIEEYDRALALPIQARHLALFNRALAWQQLGEVERARQDINEALALQPDWTLARERLQQLEATAAEDEAGNAGP